MAEESEPRNFTATIEWMEGRRRTDTEITDLARRIIMGDAFVTSHVHEIDAGFSFILMFERFEPGVAELVGAVIGNMRETLGREVNGVPMFTSIDFLHVEDVERLRAELLRMEVALGITTPPCGLHDAPGCTATACAGPLVGDR